MFNHLYELMYLLAWIYPPRFRPHWRLCFNRHFQPAKLIEINVSNIKPNKWPSDADFVLLWSTAWPAVVWRTGQSCVVILNEQSYLACGQCRHKRQRWTETQSLEALCCYRSAPSSAFPICEADTVASHGCCSRDVCDMKKQNACRLETNP